MFINEKGKLFRVTCPFRVRRKNQIKIKEHQLYVVDKIFQINDTTILFEINKEEVSHGDYELLI